MTSEMKSNPLAVQHHDLKLVRGLQAITLCGVLLGLILYAWIAVHNEMDASQRRLASAAAAGQVAADAELARIDAAVSRISPLIADAVAGTEDAAEARALQLSISETLSSTPVMAIAVLDRQGGIKSVFGQMPSDAAGHLAPPSFSKRAGQQLVDLDIVPVSPNRAAYYRDITLADGARLPAVFVLRRNTFGAALNAGTAAGDGWRAALLNLDGKVVLSNAAPGRTFTSSDVSLVDNVLGWQPLYTDQAAIPGKLSGSADGVFLEIRSLAGGQMHVVYLGDEPSVLTIIASRKMEFLALFGVSMLALVLALSLIQNEWQRKDAEQEDTFLVLAQARASCDLLDAGAIDWSVKDGRIVYSQGWAEMFARGVKPQAEEAHDWICRIHPQDQEAAREIYQSLLDGKVSDIEHRLRIRLPLGLWAQVLERGRAINGLDGKPARIVLIQTPEAADGSALRASLSGLSPQKDYAAAG